MGRSWYSFRDEANNLRTVSIFRLKKWGYLKRGFFSKQGNLTWTNNFTDEKSDMGINVSTVDYNSYVIFEYTVNNWKRICERFNLLPTKCSFGGIRYWFECSNIKDGRKCGRRVGMLYIGDQGILACRHCHNLTYSSRKTSGRDKAFGSIFPAADVNEAHEAVKREFYAGKPTQKYLQYLRKAHRFRTAYGGQLSVIGAMVDRISKRKKRRTYGEKN